MIRKYLRGSIIAQRVYSLKKEVNYGIINGGIKAQFPNQRGGGLLVAYWLKSCTLTSKWASSCSNRSVTLRLGQTHFIMACTSLSLPLWVWLYLPFFLWHNAWPFVSVCVGATQTISLSVLARNPHKGLRTRSPARPEVEEGGKVPAKTERASWQSRAEEDGRLEIAVQGKDGQQKEAVR